MKCWKWRSGVAIWKRLNTLLCLLLASTTKKLCLRVRNRRNSPTRSLLRKEWSAILQSVWANWNSLRLAARLYVILTEVVSFLAAQMWRLWSCAEQKPTSFASSKATMKCGLLHRIRWITKTGRWCLRKRTSFCIHPITQLKWATWRNLRKRIRGRNGFLCCRFSEVCRLWNFRP